MNPAAQGLDAIEAAMRELRLACRELDGDAILAAVEQRGFALDRLGRKLGSMPPAERRAVRDAVASNAREAEQALREAQRDIAGQFRKLAEGAHALRHYAVRTEGNSALDRSG